MVEEAEREEALVQVGRVVVLLVLARVVVVLGMFLLLLQGEVRREVVVGMEEEVPLAVMEAVEEVPLRLRTMVGEAEMGMEEVVQLARRILHTGRSAMMISHTLHHWGTDIPLGASEAAASAVEALEVSVVVLVVALAAAAAVAVVVVAAVEAVQVHPNQALTANLVPHPQAKAHLVPTQAVQRKLVPG